MPCTTTISSDNEKMNVRRKETDELRKTSEQSTVSNQHKDDCNDLRRREKKEDFIILLEISFRNYALVTIGAPVLALATSFLFGFFLDYQQILNYDWKCGPVNIPSFSRIINLSKERIIWNAAVLFHLPLRFLLIAINYKICRIPSNELCNRKLHEILSRIIIISGVIEVLMILLLTVIGEREESSEFHSTSFNWHVHFFIVFAISSTVYFSIVTTTYRRSKHYAKHCNLLLIYIAAYNFFALSEYSLILVNYGFHASVIYDCNDIYQFRVLKHHKIV
uniref:Post-GPI attachment to proteins factor 2-like n=1 Tax=Elaeophora elaphi TaxID=1147741 RepID=A0A0R3S1I6_9BILA